MGGMEGGRGGGACVAGVFVVLLRLVYYIHAAVGKEGWMEGGREAGMAGGREGGDIRKSRERDERASQE